METYIGVQYTDRGRINGIDSLVNRDEYTKEILLDERTVLPNVENLKTNKNKTEEILYTVRRGETLWKIARKYETSINEIAKLNNIQNPDLIYVGERLRI